jgi:hypothetical protein
VGAPWWKPPALTARALEAHGLRVAPVNVDAFLNLPASGSIASGDVELDVVEETDTPAGSTVPSSPHFRRCRVADDTK